MSKVSRRTFHEALRALEQKGLITIKIGVNGGAIVKGVTTNQVSQNLALLIGYQRVSLKDLVEFREGIEGMLVSLAAERAVKENTYTLNSRSSALKSASWFESIQTCQW